MKDKLVISVYGSHNAAISMFYKGEYTVIEIERWTNSKNAGLTTYMPSQYPQIIFDEITEYLLSTTDRSDVDVLLTDYVKDITPKFHVGETLGFDHHTAHAATAFYQSPYREALVFTFDGGGDGGFFNVYKADRTNGIVLIDKFDQDLGFPYMILCDYISDIKKESMSIGNLVYAGKIMGLCSYGKIREEWVPHFEKFYSRFNYVGSSYIGGAEVRFSALTELFENIGLTDFDFEHTRYEGQLAWDLAATSQKAFENQFFKFAQKYLNEYPEMPVAMAGGCALNVLLNTKLLNLRNNKVFVPPNVNDCGISVGGLLWYLNPENQVDLTYSGTPLIDKHQLGTYLQEYNYKVTEKVTIDELAKYIADGHIVGIIQGNSEHGSRALGNRSIICNPVGDMKDVLNNKVKHREWYRPFAPIVRLEDTPTYFEFDKGAESRHMVFVATVKEEWRAKLPAITHEDNTARLQTVTRGQNEFIYDLITAFEKHSGHGVILNTSFNVDGKPILTRFSDALKILRETELDAVYFENKLIFKGNDNSFKRDNDSIENTLSETTSIGVLSFKPKGDNINNDIEQIKSLMINDRNITVIIPQYHHNKFIEKLPENDKLKYYVIDSSKHWYDSRMKGKFDLGRETTSDYAKYIKLFWCKEVILLNHFKAKYHLFVNLDEMNEREYAYNIARDIQILSEFAKTDNHVVITSKKDLSTIFTTEYIKEKFNVEVKHHPTSALFCGNNENVIWMCNNYEGILLGYMDTGKIGTETDYLLASSLENSHRYKFLDA